MIPSPHDTKSANEASGYSIQDSSFSICYVSPPGTAHCVVFAPAYCLLEYGFYKLIFFRCKTPLLVKELDCKIE